MTTSTPLHFSKSSYSTARGDNCVEVADFDGGSAIRDTQNREAGHLTFGAAEWAALVSTAQHHGGPSHLAFRKSSYSSGRQENCVEVAEVSGSAAVRDSQNPQDGHFLLPGSEWGALLGAVRR